MANLIEAIANACGQTVEMSKIYIDRFIGRVEAKIAHLPTNADMKRVSQYSLLGEADTDHKVVIAELTESARYKIFTNASADTVQIQLQFYESYEGTYSTETLTLGSGRNAPCHTVEFLGVRDKTGGQEYVFDVNGEEQSLFVSSSSGSFPVLQKITFTGVDSVYLFTLGTEVVVKDGKSVHIRFSQFPNGALSTKKWTEGQNYIGIAVAVEEPTDSEDFTWVMFIPNEKKLYRHDIAISWTNPNELRNVVLVNGVCFTSSENSITREQVPVGTVLHGTITASPDGTGYYDIPCVVFVTDIGKAVAYGICDPYGYFKYGLPFAYIEEYFTGDTVTEV